MHTYMRVRPVKHDVPVPACGVWHQVGAAVAAQVDARLGETAAAVSQFRK